MIYSKILFLFMKALKNMKSIILLISIFLLPSIQIYAANYPLEIIQPRAGLTTTNRFYKAYPGLEYNVRMAVIGGAYPFVYSLSAAPVGMTINSSTGEILWPNPLTVGSPHAVTARVTDSESTIQTVSFTVTVTTSGFRFIDAINGRAATSGGTGTISNPWKSILDMYEGNTYESKRADSYANEFLYFLNGTYFTNVAFTEDGTRVPLVEYKKPLVWLAYPNTQPVIDLSGLGTLAIYGGSNNAYFDGLTFKINTNTRKIGISIESGASNVTFRRNIFDGGNMVGVVGGNNALLFITNSGKGNYWSLQDNIGKNVSGGYWLLGYTANKVLVENNIISNISGHSIGPKLNVSNWFIRGNQITNASGDGINVMYYATSEDIEISYNRVQMNSGNAVSLNQERVSTGGDVYVYRNTLQGGVRIYNVTSTNGPFLFSKNVIINDTISDKITRNEITDPSRLISTDNLGGISSQNIVDINGKLTPNFIKYLGTHGFEIGSSTPANSSTLGNPQNLRVNTP